MGTGSPKLDKIVDWYCQVSTVTCSFLGDSRHSKLYMPKITVRIQPQVELENANNLYTLYHLYYFGISSSLVVKCYCKLLKEEGISTWVVLNCSSMHGIISCVKVIRIHKEFNAVSKTAYVVFSS